MVDLTTEAAEQSLIVGINHRVSIILGADDSHRSPGSFITTILTLTNKDPSNLLLRVFIMGGIAAGSGPSQFRKI